MTKKNNYKENCSLPKKIYCILVANEIMLCQNLPPYVRCHPSAVRWTAGCPPDFRELRNTGSVAEGILGIKLKLLCFMFKDQGNQSELRVFFMLKNHQK